MGIPILNMKPVGHYSDGPKYGFSTGGFPSRGVQILPMRYADPADAFDQAHIWLRHYLAKDPMGNMGCVLGVTLQDGKYHGVVNTYHSNT